MKERPILFSAPMVRAILAGTKTVTRRIIAPQPHRVEEQHLNCAEPGEPPVVVTQIPGWEWKSTYVADGGDFAGALAWHSPYGQSGDRLWVKETHAIANGAQCVAYRADGECGAWFDDGGGGRIWWRHGGIIGPEWRRPESWRGGSYGLDKYGGRWRPSIHMPRWASRITLEVVSVRVERLHDITEDDARAEGIERHDDDGVTYYGPLNRGHACAKIAFAELWDSINGERAAWASNPWVWRVEFKPMRGER